MSNAEHLLSQYAFNVLAGNLVNVVATGNHIRVVDADRDFSLSIDNGQAVIIEKGMALTLPRLFSSFQIIAPAAGGVIGRVIVSDGIVEDNRASISAQVATNQLTFAGAPLEVDGGALAIKDTAGDTVAIIAALDTKIEWVVIQNRGGTQIAVSNAADERDDALILEPGEKTPPLLTGGPLHVSNISLAGAGQYSAIYGQRA